MTSSFKVDLPSGVCVPIQVKPFWLYYCVCVCQRVCWIRIGRNLFCLLYRLLNTASGPNPTLIVPWVPLGMSLRPCNFATCEVFNLHKTRVMININKIFNGCGCPRGSIF